VSPARPNPADDLCLHARPRWPLATRALLAVGLAGLGCLTSLGCAMTREGRLADGRAAPPALASADSPPPDFVADEIAAAEQRASDHAPVIRQQSEDDASFFSTDTLEKLKPKRVYDSVRQKTPWRKDEEMGRAALREADDLFRQGKYTEAIKSYKTAAFRWPDSIIEEDALFLLGECYFFTDDYPEASDTFLELLKKYSNTRHLDKVMHRQFAIGRYWQELENADPEWFLIPNVTDDTRPMFFTSSNALAAYESVRLNDPTGPLADDSVMATANAYFVEEKFQDADYYYQILRNEYPRSEHLKEAYVLGLRSKMRTYQGPVYDGVPLADSEDLVNQMLVQFPTELGEERQRLLEDKRNILEQRAERDWQMASYYHKNKYYGAVRFYCQKIIKEYPETSFAQQAAARIEEIKGKPDQPKNYFNWIEDVLPGRR
jgi:outer membrane protein assembly factor BamD (BamD/ComL family)